MLSAAATVPLMAMYGFVGLIPVVMAMAVAHGMCEAIQSPGTQAAVAEAAPRADAAAAPGTRRGGGIGGRGDRRAHARRRCSPPSAPARRG